MFIKNGARRLHDIVLSVKFVPITSGRHHVTYPFSQTAYADTCIMLTSSFLFFSPAYFRRKAQAHSVWLSVLLYVLLSVLTSFCPSVFHMKVQNSYSYISILLKLYRCLNHALNCACGLDIIIRLTFDIFSQFGALNFRFICSVT